ncbi:uncharacterized protein LOC115627227 [Scaptodrosophila lebanonensis]|uniref:Uncharacterized protein LOC115627227 n=1 Tax=Drosophila lebanonensis TaxID=7225 RepID=A0A6J2TT11_DROLE|nr:uncharacterized protein LOC115627227 [Scaptodrosophila lebanonensis]
MDAFIRELSLSPSTSIDQVAPHCAKLLSWLQECHQQMETHKDVLKLSYRDIESMLKAALYVFECHKLLGDKLVGAVEELIQQIHADSHKIVLRFCDTFLSSREQVIQQLCYRILGTVDGHTHAPMLHYMHKAFADVQPEWKIISTLDWKQPENETEPLTLALQRQYTLMHRFVNRIFSLPTLVEIEVALHRAMACMGFGTWLQMFRESTKSVLYNRCCVLRHMICDILDKGTEPLCSTFVHNIYLYVADGTEMELQKFWNGLYSDRFASSLTRFFYNYWSRHLEHVDLNELKLTNGKTKPVLPLDQVLYVTHLMLDSSSPCRNQFYGELRTLKQSIDLHYLLNKVAFVYT